MRAPILIVQGGDATRRMLLTGEEAVTIGRHESNTLSFPEDARLSKFHCAIERAEGGFVIRDLDSLNGTAVNGRRVNQHTLQSDDDVVIGHVRLRFQVRELDAALVRKARAAQGDDASEPIRLKPEAGEAPELELAPESPSPASLRRAPQFSKRTKTSKSADGGDEHQRLVEATVEDARALASVIASMPAAPFKDADIVLLSADGKAVSLPNISNARQAVEQRSEGVMFLRALLTLCLMSRATDLHVEQTRERFEVRLRIDGLMAPICSLHPSIGSRMMRFVKVLGNIDIAQSQSIQEGHFSARLPDRVVDFRISFTPAMYGQKLVVRLLDPANAPQRLKDLAMPEWMSRELSQVLRRDSGMVLMCGPTGSGKTSTLYSMMREIDRSTRNVITIEDPVEYQLSDVTQLPVAEEKGNSFATLLRSVLRQDPDVLLVGEVRDVETARIAMQAATTGHLVLSTVHAKDTIGAIFRLVELGVEPSLVATGLNYVLAQRLVRRLCPECKRQTRPTASQITRLSKHGMRTIQYVYEPVGCERCLQTGYSGRQGIFELLTATEDLRDVVLTSGKVQDIRKALRNTVFSTLHDAACQLVADGVTSLDEVERVIGQ